VTRIDLLTVRPRSTSEVSRDLRDHYESIDDLPSFLQLSGYHPALNRWAADADDDELSSRSPQQMEHALSALEDGPPSIVTIFIREGALREDTLRLLRKLVDWLERDWTLLVNFQHKD
jgi:hypothetical protein